MKVLFENEIKSATLTADTPNPSFPASNLANDFARLKFKSLGFSDTVTAVFPANVSASCFFYTYTNATAMTLRLYSNASVLLDTITVDCTYESGAEYFTQLDNVRTIEVDLSSPVDEDVYLGGIALGVESTFPYPLADFSKTLVDTSSKETSAHGQVSHNYIEPLTAYSLKFSNVNRDTTYDLLYTSFRSVGSGHIWADITEQNHAVYQPLYCTSEMIESPTRKDTRVSFSLKLTEAR